MKNQKLIDEGYSVHHRKRANYPDDLIVFVLDKSGMEIASVVVEVEQNHVSTNALGVDHKHRRKGIATEMYIYIEKITGKIIDSPEEDRSEHGDSFWKQNNRPFGKKE